MSLVLTQLAHCRRRKIRCLPSAYFDGRCRSPGHNCPLILSGKCENCMRTGKNCQFLKVSEDSPILLHKRPDGSPGVRFRSFSEERIRLRTQHMQPFIIQPQTVPGISTSSCPPADPQHEQQGLYTQSQSLPYETTSHWKPNPHDEIEQIHSPRQPFSSRPALYHRITEPVRFPRSSLAEESDSYDNFQVTQLVHACPEIAMQPSDVYHTATIPPWPLHGFGTPYTTDVCSSRTSERSSSLEGPRYADPYHGLSPWPPSPTMSPGGTSKPYPYESIIMSSTIPKYNSRRPASRSGHPQYTMNT